MTTYENMTMRQVRDVISKYNKERHAEFTDWKHSPYTCLKAALFIETSTLLTYFLLKNTTISANAVSVIHIAVAMVGAVLLAIPARAAIFIGVMIFFFKATLDWVDGTIARMKGQESITGGVLDPYSGTMGGVLPFQMGLGFYVAYKSGIVVFYYLTALVPLFLTAMLQPYALYLIYIDHITAEKIKEYIRKGNAPHRYCMPEAAVRGGLRKAYEFIITFFDGSARGVDLVCLLIIIELFTPIFVTWVAFLIFFIRPFLLFASSFYIVARGGWAESKLEEKMHEITGSFTAVPE